jgi:hypothetical protein
MGEIGNTAHYNKVICHGNKISPVQGQQEDLNFVYLNILIFCVNCAMVRYTSFTYIEEMSKVVRSVVAPRCTPHQIYLQCTLYTLMQCRKENLKICLKLFSLSVGIMKLKHA